MFGTFVLGSNTEHFIIENLFKVQKNIGVSQSKPNLIATPMGKYSINLVDISFDVCLLNGDNKLSAS